MKIAKLSFPGIASICAGLAMLTLAGPASAQNCYPAHSAGFSRIRSLEQKAATQSSADVEVRAIFGPRNELCEEGAYKLYMENFKEFAAQAMRAPKNSRDKLLRLAIALVMQAPTKVPAKEAKMAASFFRQVRSDLNATADDVGFATTPLLQQLLDALANAGAPRAAEQPGTTSPEPTRTAAPPTSNVTTSTSTPGGVQSIPVPGEPLPPWAVIKLYEMRDYIKNQDLPAIQIRLQEVINWIESRPRDNP